MFYSLQATWQIILLLAALAVFAAASWRWPRWSGELVVFLAPLYLLKINGLPITVLEALMWLFILVWLAAKIKNRQGDWWREIFSGYSRGFWWPLVLILAGAFLAATFSSDWRVSFGVFKAYFIAPLIFSLVLAEVFKDGGFKNIFLALFGSAVAVAIISLGYAILGRLTFDSRLAAFYLSPNHLAMGLAPGLIAGFSLLFEVKKPFWRTLLLVISYSLLAIVLYFTYSYGAWLGLAATALFVLVYLWRSRAINGRQLLLAAGFLLAAVLAAGIPQFSGDGKLAALLVSPRSSWQSRLMIWRAVWRILKDHWFFGIGPGLFQQYYLAYQQYFPPYLEWAVPQPHNLFLAWWLQTGLPGLAGFILLLVNFLKQTTALLAKTKLPLTLFLSAVMIYILAHGLVDTTFWKNDLALIFWLIAVLGSKATRRAD